jgi:hypothetical protein
MSHHHIPLLLIQLVLFLFPVEQLLVLLLVSPCVARLLLLPELPLPRLELLKALLFLSKLLMKEAWVVGEWASPLSPVELMSSSGRMM